MYRAALSGLKDDTPASEPTPSGDTTQRSEAYLMGWRDEDRILQSGDTPPETPSEHTFAGSGATGAASEEKTFPVVTPAHHSDRDCKAYPPRIPWRVAELAYSVYVARWGGSQSLERLAQRGGFHPGEMDEFLLNWRELAEDARVAKAVRDQMEADCKAVCGRCAAGDDLQFKDYLGWYHLLTPPGRPLSHEPCRADAIRARASDDKNHG